MHRRCQDDPFPGKGGLYNKSRWASKGQWVSYAANHLATATLEKLAGARHANLMTEMVYAIAEIDLSYVSVLSKDECSSDWNALPAPESRRAWAMPG